MAIGINEDIDYAQLRKMEKELGCIFCDDGVFAEMSMELQSYREKTNPIANVDFEPYQGNLNDLKELVLSVDEEWGQYFNENTFVFCGYSNEKVVSFCIVDTDADCIISGKDIKVGSIGCVGTIPEYRGKGIGLRMVDLATIMLKDAKCDKAYISYTHIENWYKKLGYQTFARFHILS